MTEKQAKPDGFVDLSLTFVIEGDELLELATELSNLSTLKTKNDEQTKKIWNHSKRIEKIVCFLKIFCFFLKKNYFLSCFFVC